MRFDPFIRLLCPHLAEIPWLALSWLNYTLNNLQLATAFMPVDFAQLYLKSHFLKTWFSDTTLKLTDVCLLSWLLKTLPSITAFRHSMCFRTFAFFVPLEDIIKYSGLESITWDTVLTLQTFSDFLRNKNITFKYYLYAPKKNASNLQLI